MGIHDDVPLYRDRLPIKLGLGTAAKGEAVAGGAIIWHIMAYAICHIDRRSLHLHVLSVPHIPYKYKQQAVRSCSVMPYVLSHAELQEPGFFFRWPVARFAESWLLH